MKAPRKGRSRDYPVAKRRFIFQRYIDMKDKHAQYEIAEAVGISPTMFSLIKCHSHWWKEMLEEYNQENQIEE